MSDKDAYDIGTLDRIEVDGAPGPGREVWIHVEGYPTNWPEEWPGEHPAPREASVLVSEALNESDVEKLIEVLEESLDTMDGGW